MHKYSSVQSYISYLLQLKWQIQHDNNNNKNGAKKPLVCSMNEHKIGETAKKSETEDRWCVCVCVGLGVLMFIYGIDEIYKTDCNSQFISTRKLFRNSSHKAFIRPT